MFGSSPPRVIGLVVRSAALVAFILVGCVTVAQSSTTTAVSVTGQSLMPTSPTRPVVVPTSNPDIYHAEVVVGELLAASDKS